MPKMESRVDETLTQSSLTLGTKETFFYLSSLVKLGEKLETLNPAAIAAPWGDCVKLSPIATSQPMIGKLHLVRDRIVGRLATECALAIFASGIASD
jgi:hypothetical protein